MIKNIFLQLVFFSHYTNLFIFSLYIPIINKFSRKLELNIKYSGVDDLNQYDSCDVAIIGAGVSGLAAASILSSIYGMKVYIFESHYHIGGCAHSFPITARSNGNDFSNRATYEFDSGPTIILGCSNQPFNPLQQVLNAVGAKDSIDWIKYNSWGMHAPDTGKWTFELGANKFDGLHGPLLKYGGKEAVQEFQRLRTLCEPLCAGAAGIPSMALRGDKWRLLPLLGSLDALKKVVPYSDVLDGSFEVLLKQSNIKNNWLLAWLDALAFSLSGLPAKQTGAAALAYTLFDLHREDATLDYPRGGIGQIAKTFHRAIVDSSTGSKVFTKATIENIAVENNRAAGLILSNGKTISAKKGVICTANVWALEKLMRKDANRLNEQQHKFFFNELKYKIKTKSFLHLHLGLHAKGLDKSTLQPHYTIMDKGLTPFKDETGAMIDACSDQNMVAVSNPSILDDSLVNMPDRLNIHAYSAGNEPYDEWKGLNRFSFEYKNKKLIASELLYRSVSTALNIDIKEIKERSEVSFIGTPLTHERFLRRDDGTYGSAWGEMLDGPLTPLPGLLLAGDGVFPGIGIPAVALSGANAANTMVNVFQHLYELLKL
eukprot:gene6510-8948_t